MRKSLAVLATTLLIPAVGPAAEAVPREGQIERSLRVNRLLLAQYSRESGGLRRQQRERTSRVGQDRLIGLRYKIEALKEDRKLLKSRLPISVQADAFLSEFLKRRGPPPVPRKTAAPKAEIDTARLHEEALKFVGERRMGEAARVYEEIVLADPEDDEAYLLLGHVYLMSGQYDKAEFAYYSAVHIDRNNYGEIIPFYQNLVVQSPDDDAYRCLGYAYVILGDGTKAKDAYQEALRINPANLEAQKGLVILSQRFGV